MLCIPHQIEQRVQYEIDEKARTLRLWVRRKRGNQGFICSGCGGRCTKIAEIRQREVRDLPWRKYQTFVVIEFLPGAMGEESEEAGTATDGCG
jgi:transposase